MVLTLSFLHPAHFSLPRRSSQDAPVETTEPIRYAAVTLMPDSAILAGS